jgi:uncharacterized protein with GYD domain
MLFLYCRALGAYDGSAIYEAPDEATAAARIMLPLSLDTRGDQDHHPAERGVHH